MFNLYPPARIEPLFRSARERFSAKLTFGILHSLCPGRCRFSASPATGLVGFEENELLSDYFRCFSVLPLTRARYRVVPARDAPAAKRLLFLRRISE